MSSRKNFNTCSTSCLIFRGKRQYHLDIVGVTGMVTASPSSVFPKLTSSRCTIVQEQPESKRTSSTDIPSTWPLQFNFQPIGCNKHVGRWYSRSWRRWWPMESLNHRQVRVGITNCYHTKEDGSLRLCVDYHWLNATSYSDDYLMPQVDDLTDCIGGLPTLQPWIWPIYVGGGANLHYNPGFDGSGRY